MAYVTNKDYDTLQNGLRELYAHHSLATLPRVALKLASALVPNDLAGYNEVDPERPRIQVVLEPDDRANDWLNTAEAWERYMHQHPLVTHQQQKPTDGARKISDFLSDQDYRKLELYTECYSKIGANYQIALRMSCPSPLLVALAFNREKKDFDERDRQLLNLVRPHLRQAYENAVVISELAGHLDRAYGVLDRIDRGIVVINDQGRIFSASPAAVRFSLEHFGGEADAALTNYLPDTLACWAKSQIVALRQTGDEAVRPSPLIVDGPNGRLVMRLASDREPGRYLVTMHLARPHQSEEPLQELGLSKREAEVLFWMVKGKKNLDIGTQLGISERTIDKHAQNLFSKLEVTGRTEAITKALEWLRL